MWSEKHCLTLALIAAISIHRTSAQAQFQNTDEYRENETVQTTQEDDTESITDFISNTYDMHSTQIWFEIDLANSMKNFVPFSIARKNCVRDGLRYKSALNNHEPWAVQSE